MSVGLRFLFRGYALGYAFHLYKCTLYIVQYPIKRLWTGSEQPVMCKHPIYQGILFWLSFTSCGPVEKQVWFYDKSVGMGKINMRKQSK